MKHKSNIWTEDRLIKMGFCFECGANDEIHYHHIVPHSKGGRQTIPLCLNCHSKVHDRKITSKELLREGREKAKERGVRFGRKEGFKETNEVFLSKPIVKEIINELLKTEHTYITLSEKLRCSFQRIQKTWKAVKETDIALYEELRKKQKEFRDNRIETAKRLETERKEQLMESKKRLRDEKRERIEKTLQMINEEYVRKEEIEKQKIIQRQETIWVKEKA